MAIAREVPEYARPLEGAFGEGIQIGTTEALTQFLELIRDPASDRDRERGIYMALGRGERRQGRSLDSLQAAYRVGARVAWQRFSRAGEAAGLDPTVLYQLADAIFAYIDELSSESVEGYAQQQAVEEGTVELLRVRLLVDLLRDPSPGTAEIQRRALAAQWPVPDEVAALACDPTIVAQIARRLGPGTLSGEIEGVGCLIIPDPDGPGMTAQLTAACRDEPATLGHTVPGPSVRGSWLEANALWMALESGDVASTSEAEGPLRTEDHLMNLVLLDSRARLGRVAARRFAALLDETPSSRRRLLRTLDLHLRHQGRIGPVAHALEVHPQTVRYRIARLRELLGAQMEDPDARFEIEATLRSDILEAVESG